MWLRFAIDEIERSRMRNSFCSAPTCEPDPDNSDGGNKTLVLDPGATITFAKQTRFVVIDVQGIGDNPFVLLVTDGRGRTETVESQGTLFGVTLIGLAAHSGIATVEVESVGGTGGPVVLARVLFSEDVDKDNPAPR